MRFEAQSYNNESNKKKRKPNRFPLFILKCLKYYFVFPAACIGFIVPLLAPLLTSPFFCLNT